MLTVSQVREIAAGWANGGDALQSLATTGAILPHTINVIDDNIVLCDDESWVRELRELREYCEDMGERGPVEGWGSVRF